MHGLLRASLLLVLSRSSRGPMHQEAEDDNCFDKIKICTSTNYCIGMSSVAGIGGITRLNIPAVCITTSDVSLLEEFLMFSHGFQHVSTLDIRHSKHANDIFICS